MAKLAMPPRPYQKVWSRIRSHRRRGSRASSPTSSGARPSSTTVRTATRGVRPLRDALAPAHRAVVGLDAGQRHAAEPVAVVGLGVLQRIGPQSRDRAHGLATSVGGIGRAGARALDQPHGDELRRRRPAGEPVEQEPGGRPPDLRGVLRQHRQRRVDELEGRDVVGDQHRDVARHAQPGRRARRAARRSTVRFEPARIAVGGCVAASRPRRRPRRRTPSSTAPPRPARRARARPRPPAAPRPTRGPGGWPAARRRARCGGGRGRRRYVGDGAHAAVVVHEHGGGAELRRQLAVDGDHGHAQARQARAGGPARSRRRAAGACRRRAARPAGRTCSASSSALVLGVGQQDGVAAARAARPPRPATISDDVGAAEVAHQEADGVRGALPQAAGQQVRLVAELAHGLDHAVARLLADVRVAAEGPRRGRDRDARARRDLAQPGRRSAAPASRRYPRRASGRPAAPAGSRSRCRPDRAGSTPSRPA